ncbi:MAG: DUF167 domain-containing protein [Gallionella sp.]
MPLFSEKNKDKKSAKKDQPCCHWEDDTLVLNILGRPNSKRDAIGRIIGHQLEVSVKAIPKMGGATAYMVRYLAEEFGVSRSAITVVFGERNVNKQLRIQAPQNLPAVVATELARQK